MLGPSSETGAAWRWGPARNRPARVREWRDFLCCAFKSVHINQAHTAASRGTQGGRHEVSGGDLGIEISHLAELRRLDGGRRVLGVHPLAVRHRCARPVSPVAPRGGRHVQLSGSLQRPRARAHLTCSTCRRWAHTLLGTWQYHITTASTDAHHATLPGAAPRRFLRRPARSAAGRRRLGQQRGWRGRGRHCVHLCRARSIRHRHCCRVRAAPGDGARRGRFVCGARCLRFERTRPRRDGPGPGSGRVLATGDADVERHIRALLAAFALLGRLRRAPRHLLCLSLPRVSRGRLPSLLRHRHLCMCLGVPTLARLLPTLLRPFRRLLGLFAGASCRFPAVQQCHKTDRCQGRAGAMAECMPQHDTHCFFRPPLACLGAFFPLSPASSAAPLAPTSPPLARIASCPLSSPAAGAPSCAACSSSSPGSSPRMPSNTDAPRLTPRRPGGFSAPAPFLRSCGQGGAPVCPPRLKVGGPAASAPSPEDTSV